MYFRRVLFRIVATGVVITYASLFEFPVTKRKAPNVSLMAISPSLGSSNTVRSSFRVEPGPRDKRSAEHTSELQSHLNLVCPLLLQKKKSPFAIHVTRGSS